MKKILIKLSFGIVFIVILITCTQEVFNSPKVEQENDNETNDVIIVASEDTNLYTVDRIKKMIHQAVLKSPAYSFDHEKNAYVFNDYDLMDYYYIDNPTDLIYMIANLELDKQIDLSNLGPQAQSHYDDFRGVNKGVIIRNTVLNNYGSWYRYVPAELFFRGDWTPYYFVPYYMVNIGAEREVWIRNCMKMIERNTRVRFVKDTDDYHTQTDIKGYRVRFPFASHARLRIEGVDDVTSCGGSNGAHAGCASTGGNPFKDTFIHLDNQSGFNQRVILHELGHTLRLYHEHQRSDRNDYFINAPGSRYVQRHYRNCRWHGDSLNYGDELDFASVMNYNGFNYAINQPDTFFKLYRFQYNLEDDVPFVSGATRANANTYMNNRVDGTPLANLLNALDNNRISFNGNTDLSFFPDEYFPNNVNSKDERVRYVCAQFYGLGNGQVTIVNVNTNQTPLSDGNVYDSITLDVNFLQYCKDITRININIPPGDRAFDRNPHTYDELVNFVHSVHEVNFRLIDDFIYTRIEGSPTFNPNSRLNYFHIAPILFNEPIQVNHFLSEGDINTLNWVYDY